MRDTEDMIQSIGNEKFTGSIYLGRTPSINAPLHVQKGSGAGKEELQPKQCET